MFQYNVFKMNICKKVYLGLELPGRTGPSNTNAAYAAYIVGIKDLAESFLPSGERFRMVFCFMPWIQYTLFYFGLGKGGRRMAQQPELANVGGIADDLGGVDPYVDAELMRLFRLV